MWVRILLLQISKSLKFFCNIFFLMLNQTDKSVIDKDINLFYKKRSFDFLSSSVGPEKFLFNSPNSTFDLEREYMTRFDFRRYLRKRRFDFFSFLLRLRHFLLTFNKFFQLYIPSLLKICFLLFFFSGICIDFFF